MTLSLIFQAVLGVITLVLAIILLANMRKSAVLRKFVPLVKGERVRPLVMEYTEPFLEVAIIAILLWDELSGGWDHWLVGALGIIPGYLLGRYRANIMFVRAIKEHKAVVMRRSGAEYVAVALVIAIKVLGEQLPNTSEITSLIISVALITVVAESAFRVLRIRTLYDADVDNTHLKTSTI